MSAKHSAIGRVLTASTHTSDIEAAVRVRDGLVRSWKAEFAKARCGDAVSTDADLKLRYQAARAASPIEGDYVRLMTVMRELARAAGLSPEAWAEALRRSGFNAEDALRSAPDGARAVEHSAVVLGTRRPFLHHLDAWWSHHEEMIRRGEQAISQKTLYGYKRDLAKFAAQSGTSLETFSRDVVQSYIDARSRAGKDVRTIKKELSAISNYWSHVLALEPTLKSRNEGHDPFHRLAWPRERTRVYQPENPAFVVLGDDERGGPRYTPEQVPLLWRRAHDLGDEDLRDVIVICAYTGARREGVCRL